jgi:hypothetical protein
MTEFSDILRRGPEKRWEARLDKWRGYIYDRKANCGLKKNWTGVHCICMGKEGQP